MSLISCVVALQMFATVMSKQYIPIAGWEIKHCTLSEETKRSWVEVEWKLKESGFQSRTTVNHIFDDKCQITDTQVYVDDKQSQMSISERAFVRARKNLMLMHLSQFVKEQCKKMQKP